MSLSTLLAAFHTTAFTVFGNPMTWSELVGFVTGALNVGLLAKRNIWNWPIGIANNALFLLIFAAAGLYADSGLQIVYIII
jgi:nicotinamide mononucleotide transporter